MLQGSCNLLNNSLVAFGGLGLILEWNDPWICKKRPTGSATCDAKRQIDQDLPARQVARKRIERLHSTSRSDTLFLVVQT